MYNTRWGRSREAGGCAGRRVVGLALGEIAHQAQRQGAFVAPEFERGDESFQRSARLDDTLVYDGVAAVKATIKTALIEWRA